MQSYIIHVRVIQSQPTAWYDIVEKTVFHNARGGAWTDCADECVGDQTLTMGGSGTSGMLRFKNQQGEQFAVALGVHNYKRWCDIVPDVPLDQTAVDIHPSYYPSTVDTGKRGKIVQRVLEDRVILMFFRILEDRVLEVHQKANHTSHDTSPFHFITSLWTRIRFMGFSTVFVFFFLAYLAFLLVWVFVLGHTDASPKGADSGFHPTVFAEGIGNRGEMLWKQLPKLEKTTSKGQKIAVNYYKESGNVFHATITIGSAATTATAAEITAN